MSLADPPWYDCSGNAAAWAKPPRPTVSVMGLSPPMKVISSSAWPSNSRARIRPCAPRNQVSPSPLTLMANSRQLNVIAVTTLEASTSCAASAMTLAAAMDRRRNEYSLPVRNETTRPAASRSSRAMSSSGW